MSNSVKIWSYTGILLYIVKETHQPWISLQIHWHPTGAYLTGCYNDGRLKWWSDRGAELQKWCGLIGRGDTFTWNASGTKLACSYKKKSCIKIWYANDLLCHIIENVHNNIAFTIRWHPTDDSLLLTYSSKCNTFKLFKDDGTSICCIGNIHFSRIDDIQWHPNGHNFITCGDDDKSNFGNQCTST